MSAVQWYNVFIFNNIENNAKDIERLSQTFSALSCKVCEVRNQSYRNLLSIVDLIVEADFSSLNYIVIIILDNKNDRDNMWTTTDKNIFCLNNDLITAVRRNKSLSGKLRFTILQNNRNFDTDMPKPIQAVAGRTYYPGKDLTYYATSTGCSLNHAWDNNHESDFIRILCDAIDQNVTTHYPINDLLNSVSDRVAEITGELPSKLDFDRSEKISALSTKFQSKRYQWRMNLPSDETEQVNQLCQHISFFDGTYTVKIKRTLSEVVERNIGEALNFSFPGTAY